MASLAFVAFLAGILTILAPCVLPVLPVVLAGSAGEDRKNYPAIVTVSLAVSVVLFTVLLKVSTLFINVPPSFWTDVSGGIVLFLGLTYLFPHAWTQIMEKLGGSKTQGALEKASEAKSPFWRAVLTGAALGPVFSSCSPTYSLLLATVFPVSFLLGLAYSVFYAVGLSLALFLVARGGMRFAKSLRSYADENGAFRKTLGVILAVVGVAILTGTDKKVEIWAAGIYDFSRLEQNVLDTVSPASPGRPIFQSVPDGASAGSGKTAVRISESVPELSVSDPFPAPEIALKEWINSSPLTMAELKGKVVVIDFWTYSCINCQRTLPYLIDWDKKYRKDGLVVIGVQAPEFAFEKVRANVEEAVKEAGITYPVVLDNDLRLWNAYQNRYWPAKYFIDRQGNVRHSHFGEGEYAESERVIRYLLSENGSGVTAPMGDVSEPSTSAWSALRQTPETYLGLERRDRYVESSSEKPAKLSSDGWTLSGQWSEDSENITAGNGASLRLKFGAKDVYLVLSGKGTVKATV